MGPPRLKGQRKMGESLKGHGEPFQKGLCVIWEQGQFSQTRRQDYSINKESQD